MTFPAEAIPDGAVLAVHHLITGLLTVLLAVWVVADNYAHREPLLAMVGAVFALVGFLLVWKWYPMTGAAMTLAGVVLVLLGVSLPGGMWSGYPLTWRVVALAGGLVALDDAVSHAFGIWTPLDAGWGQVYHLVP
ncbi:hypothetical protein ABSL23_02235 [Halobacterium sp. NMX12-1]|uniref:SPW repeat-containing protein n=1 Tax=Halobacterium sp. NMX12-1 TaxID=3166650 RepID=A0AAU8CDT7_9EURY